MTQQLASMGGDTAADNEGSGGGESVAPAAYVLGDAAGPLDRGELERVDAWWRAANRQIVADGLDAVFVAGPGHGGPGPNACGWLEGTYSELYSHTPQDAGGMAAFFAQFSYPGGVPSHCAPETPGPFHEGGELGYSLLHAYGAVLDNPGLTAFCVIGDGEAGTGPLAGSWHANKFVNPARDGAVLPILALNQYKIANPPVHRLTYRRTNHAGIHVRGYKEKGTTTTPFDMVMLNDRAPQAGQRDRHLWTARRDRWEAVHLIRTATALLGLAGTLATVLNRSDDRRAR